MKKKKQSLEGTLNKIPENQIYLNINHLKDGIYTLNIMYKNKLIKKTHFKKED